MRTTKHAPRGPFVGMECPILRPKSLPKAAPLSDDAKDLLTEFYRRRHFWDLVHRDAVPLRFAAEAALFVKPARAYEVSDELEAAGGPRRWFRAKAMELMAKGKIGRGRATVGDQIADRFFVELAGGDDQFARLKTNTLGHPDTLDPELGFRVESEEQRYLVECIEYLVWKRFHPSPRGKRG